MSKPRILYILSLVILGVLLVFTVFKPMATGGEFSEVQRESLLETEEGWIIQFDLVNHEWKDQRYTIGVSVNEGKPYRESLLLRDGRTYTFVRRINSYELSGDKDKVIFAIYKEGEDTPFEQATYYLR
ncbi:hypothetical protein ACFLUD_04355 [Chloroflexota bacterium]